MAYTTKVLQVLIASPSDTDRERSAIVDVINEWNNLNSRDTGVMLQPVRWETHTAPDMREPPQGIINAQIVDEADMVVGVFHTKLGTPTARAQSGTAEEIERVGNAGKRVMLYFSDEPVTLKDLDWAEAQRLQEFRKGTYPKGLVDSYKSIDEFVTKFRRQLDIAVKQEAPSTAVSGSTLTASAGGDVPTLVLLEPYSLSDHSTIDPAEPITLTPISVVDHENIPAYGTGGSSSILYSISSSFPGENRNYWRELVTYYEELSRRFEIAFQLTNSGESAIGDPHIEISVVAVNISTSTDVGLRQPVTYPLLASTFRPTPQPVLPPNGYIYEEDRSQAIVFEFDWPVLQAGRRVVTPNTITLVASDSGTVTFQPVLFSSADRPMSLPPITLRVEAEQEELTWAEFYSRVEAASEGDH